MRALDDPRTSAASFHISGLPAVLIILAILALIVIGIVTLVRKGRNKMR